MPRKISMDKALKTLQLLRGLREMTRPSAGQVAQQRWQFDQIRQQRQDNLTALNKIAQNMPAGAAKASIVKMMTGYFVGMDGETRESMAEMIEGSVISPLQQKMRDFQSTHRAPVWSDYSPDEHPAEYAKEWFAQQDYNYQFENYLGMKPTPIPESIWLSQNTYASRKVDGGGVGRIQILSTEDERWTELGKGLPGQPNADLIALRGFKWHTGAAQLIENGPDRISITPMVDLRDGRKYIESTRVGINRDYKGPIPPPQFATFASYHGTDSEGEATDTGRQYDRYRELINDKVPPNEALRRTIGRTAPGWNIRLVDQGEYGKGDFLFFNYHRGEKENLAWFPGVATPFPTTDGERTNNWFYDKKSDMTFDPNGMEIGTYEEALAISMGE